jgi:peptide-methionine (S)-S-oxide reductase
VFFSVHDPTTRNRQGADVGTQYRSIVLHDGEAQQRQARAVVAEIDASGVWGAPLVTEIVPLDAFYPAEEYHREYFRRNARAPYCQAVIAPKVAKLRERWRPLLGS